MQVEVKCLGPVPLLLCIFSAGLAVMQNFTEGIESLHCVFRWPPVAQDLDNLRAKDVSNRLAPRLALWGAFKID